MQGKLVLLTLSAVAPSRAFSRGVGWRALRRSAASWVAPRAAAAVALEAPPAATEVSTSVVTRDPATHPAYNLVKVEMIDEYKMKFATYKHKKSGAEVMSAQVDDDNKVFGIVFRTPVEDSTGVPHILEHSVLCGSEKYTSKEPFAELLKGSLQTFLNAFTYPDRTCYPVASQNTKDFYNLVNVYLDAVLHPRAASDATVFAQEGWHYELEDPDAPLTYKGVVFNEMKGVYSQPDSLLYRAAQQTTFPENTYAADSGGDPAVIPSLDFAQFKKFHAKYYHPANAKVFFYGDDDLEERLKLLDTYLKDFDAADADPTQSEVATHRLIPETRRTVLKYPVAPEAEETTHMILLSWLLHEAPLSQEDELALGVLDHLLMGTPTATVYKALTESGLGSAVVGGGVSDQLKQATFSAGLKGVPADQVAAVEALVVDTLKKAAADGFEADAVEASLNTIEFGLREFNTGGFPKGLSVMLGIMPRWLYNNGSPTDVLRFEAPLASLKKRLAAGEPVFEDLLKRLIIDNKHVATTELVPDPEMAAEEKKREEAVLANVKATMSRADLDFVIAETKALKAAQLKEDTPEQLATIPAVGLPDLERAVKTIPSDVEKLGAHGAELMTHALPTAGVIYADVLLDASKVPLEDLPLLRLFSTIFDEIGTSKDDAVVTQRKIGARTGGIEPAFLFSQVINPDGSAADPKKVAAHFAVRGKAVADKIQDLLDLTTDLLTDGNLDGAQAKTVELLKETKAGLEAGFLGSGNQFAAMRLGARNSLMGYISEATRGVTYYGAVQAMLREAQTDWPAMLERFKKLRATLIAQDGLIINLTADEKTLAKAKPLVQAFAARLPAATTTAPAAAWADAVELFPRVDESYAIMTQVNYVACGGRLFETGERIDGALGVVARFVSRGYLWDNVRVVGGAYGGGCSLNPQTGAFAFSSYRDPNLQATLDIYAKTADYLEEAANDLTDEALSQAIVGAVGDLDSPLNSQGKGQLALTHYLTGVTDDLRQRYRDEVLATSRESFKAFAAKLRATKLNTAIFGSEEAIKAANAKREPDEQIAIAKLG